VANQRVLRATAATLSWQPQGADGEPADPGTVTVAVTRADGTSVVAAGTAVSGSGTNPRTYTLTVAQTAALDRLTAVWTVSGTTVATTFHDVVGGFYFSVAELRALETSLSSTSDYPLARLLSVRDEVETLFESACGCAFVPRFDTDRVYGWSGSRVLLSRPFIRRVRWVRQHHHYTTSPAYTDYTASELTGVTVDQDTVVVLPYSTAGFESVEFGFEHGMDSPPADVRRAAMQWARLLANQTKSGVPDRATTMQLPDGGSVTLATPGVGRWHTGVPFVDEVLRRYDHRSPLVA
jgi:hypothetical protein